MLYKGYHFVFVWWNGRLLWIILFLCLCFFFYLLEALFIDLRILLIQKSTLNLLHSRPFRQIRNLLLILITHEFKIFICNFFFTINFLLELLILLKLIWTLQNLNQFYPICLELSTYILWQRIILHENKEVTRLAFSLF